MSKTAHANPLQSTTFWEDALAWRGAITAKLLPRIALFATYAGVVALAHRELSWEGPNPIHLGYTAGLLVVLLVLRTNAGYDRWWEARKLWGGIVNQSRNLALKGVAYGPDDDAWRSSFVRMTAAFCHAARLSLRGERSVATFERVLTDPRLAEQIDSATHMPSAVALALGRTLAEARHRDELDGFAFMELDRERAALIDHIGACERILRTPLPRVHSIKLRRFIFLYLVGVPLALASSSVTLSALSTALVAYPLLAIDQIGFELENPFSRKRESHLPLDAICETIESNVLAQLPSSETP